MTDEKWQEVVAYILKRLESETEFDVDKELFFDKFGLILSDNGDFLSKRDFPKPKYFRMAQVAHQSRMVLAFSRLEDPS